MANIPFPEINASLNGCSTVILTAGYIFIRMGKVLWHRMAMMSALFVSAVFLVCYLAYHAQTGARTPFQGVGAWRSIYYFILITHIFLAVIIVPLVLRTFYLAIKGRFELHKAWAKWTYPIWYYVSVTGVLVYFFLYQWFPPELV